jgi:hypothetical protein
MLSMWAGQRRFHSRKLQEILLFSIAPRPAPMSTQPHIQWEPRVFPSGVKRQGRQADHSPPPNADIGGAIIPLPHTSPWRGA